MIRKLLQTIVKRECKSNKVAVLLSGGVDSLTCAFALMDCSKTVVAYTFQIGEWESSDSLAAQRCAKLFGWELNIIKVPVDNIEVDFLKLANTYYCKSKTQYECTFPFIYMFPKIKERYVISGVAADGHYGLSRKAMTEVCKKGITDKESKKVFDAFRKHYFKNNTNPAGVRQLEMLSEEYGKILCTPYLNEEVFNHFIKMTWKDINKPKQKTPILNAYKEMFEVCGTRKHKNLQLCSGINIIFQKLLKTKLNINNRKAVLHLCKDYAV